MASADMIRTFGEVKRSAKARFAVHDVVEGKPVLQHVGRDLDEVSFAVRLDAGAGVDPELEIETLRAMLDTGEPQRLILGGIPRGKFVLESLDETRRHTDGRGRLLLAEVGLKLKEYN